MESVDVSWDFVVSHRLVFFLKSAFIYSFLFVHNLLSSNQFTMCISHSFHTHVGVQINEFARTITILTISRFFANTNDPNTTLQKNVKQISKASYCTFTLCGLCFAYKWRTISLIHYHFYFTRRPLRVSHSPKVIYSFTLLLRFESFSLFDEAASQFKSKFIYCNNDDLSERVINFAHYFQSIYFIYALLSCYLSISLVGSSCFEL